MFRSGPLRRYRRLRPAVFFRFRLRLPLQNTAELLNPDSLTHLVQTLGCVQQFIYIGAGVSAACCNDSLAEQV